MAKPYIHAQLSARKRGGDPELWLPLHDLFDSSKAVFADNRHRVLTHHSWFIFVVEKIFGHNIVTPEGRRVSVRDVGEQDHVAADYGNRYIPTPSDALTYLTMQDWMKIKGVDTALEHALRSAAEFGGVPDDYLEIHEAMNSSQQVMGDDRHAALTHQSFFIALLDRMFGYAITNHDGDRVPTRAIAEAHVIADLGFVPGPQDYLQHQVFLPWLNNGVSGMPDSHRMIHQLKTSKKVVRRQIFRFDEVSGPVRVSDEPSESSDARAAELAYRLD